VSILTLNNVHKNFGETPIIRGVNLSIEEGERHAIIGPNGAGKSTLFHLISGKYPVTEGTISLRGQAIQNLPPFEIARQGLARSFQVTNIFSRLSVFRKHSRWPCSGKWDTAIRSGTCWAVSMN
jgi:branched-chain amino acid transport system ATP-binding protein